jgi:hypothetical protein
MSSSTPGPRLLLPGQVCVVRFHLVDAYHSANEGAPYFCIHSMIPYDLEEYLAYNDHGGTVSAIGGSTTCKTISGTTPAYDGNYSLSPSATSSVLFDAGYGASGEYVFTNTVGLHSVPHQLLRSLPQTRRGDRSVDLRAYRNRCLPQ